MKNTIFETIIGRGENLSEEKISEKLLDYGFFIRKSIINENYIYAAISIRQCNNCSKFRYISDKNNELYKKCSGCNNTYYCSVDCQRKDWKIHKNNCTNNVFNGKLEKIFKKLYKDHLNFLMDKLHSINLYDRINKDYEIDISLKGLKKLFVGKKYVKELKIKEWEGISIDHSESIKNLENFDSPKYVKIKFNISYSENIYIKYLVLFNIKQKRNFYQIAFKFSFFILFILMFFITFSFIISTSYKLFNNPILILGFISSPFICLGIHRLIN